MRHKNIVGLPIRSVPETRSIAMNQSQPIKTTPHSRQAAPLSRQLLAIIISSTAAITANVVLYFILKNFFGVDFIAPEQFPLPEVSPLPYTDVILFSAIFSVGASLVFLVVANTVRKPTQVFAAISFIVLVASCLLPCGSLPHLFPC